MADHQNSSAGSEAEIARVHDIIARAISSDGLTHSGLRRAARDVYEHMNDVAQPSMERGAAQDLARLMQSLGYVEFAYCLSFDAYNLIVTALETAHPPADTVEPTDLPDGWEYQKDTNSVVCGGCAFRYGAEHSDADGNWTCPNCGNGNGAAQRPAATVETFERPGWCPACSCTVECALDHSSAGNAREALEDSQSLLTMILLIGSENRGIPSLDWSNEDLKNLLEDQIKQNRSCLDAIPAEPQAAQLSNLVTWTYLYATEGEAWPDHKTIIVPLIELSKHEPTQADADLLKAGGSLKGLVALSLSRPELGGK